MTPSIMEIKLAGTAFKIDPTNDQYGTEFWDKINSNLYEPDTIKFLETNVGPDSVLLDIGAANGAMTLFAASRGAKVIAYEPEPGVFQILKNNLMLNPELAHRVTLKNSGVSTTREIINFQIGQNRHIFSDIVIDSKKEKKHQAIEILSLADEISELLKQNQRIILKMDIEGAEWRILEDPNTLEILNKAEAKMLIALHPGFYRKRLPKWISSNVISKNIRRIQNLNDALFAYENLAKFGSITRSNLDKVPNKSKFALLVLAGYYEFIVDFKK